MAPTNPGGRPKLDWTSSRKRKLGRLYLLTDIAISDIQQVLKDEKFNPRYVFHIAQEFGGLI